MRLPLGLGVLGQPHDLIDGLLGDLVLSPSAGAHLGELGQPVLAKEGAPRTVTADTPTWSAISELATPSPASNSTWALRTSW
jgi:hypothetical protein